MSYRGRVLVVDDLDDVRQTLVGLLSDEGYNVCSASSRVEALQLLDAEYFYVAVLDVRLDNTDENNIEGLQLMHDIKELYPSIAIIILTGYSTVDMIQEALRPDDHGISPAYDFLKKETQMNELPEYVGRVFKLALRINVHLEILASESLWESLAEQIQFVNSPRPSSSRLIEEVDELLRKLFFGYKQIQVGTTSLSVNETTILEVIPLPRNKKGYDEAILVEIRERSLIKAESTKYGVPLGGQLEENWLLETFQIARTRSLVGIAYRNDVERALKSTLQNRLADIGKYNILVEGKSDKVYLELAAQRYQKVHDMDLLEDGKVHIIVGEGTKELAPLFGLLQSLEKEGFRFVVILDGDDVGRRVAEGMYRFHAQKNRHFFQLERQNFKGKDGRSWDVEIEDLLPWPLLEAFINLHPRAIEERFQRGDIHKVVIQGQLVEQDGKLYDYKMMLTDYISQHATLDDLINIVNVLKKARKCMGLN
jgi:CheY-like chemotaxis protein